MSKGIVFERCLQPMSFDAGVSYIAHDLLDNLTVAVRRAGRLRSALQSRDARPPKGTSRKTRFPICDASRARHRATGKRATRTDRTDDCEPGERQGSERLGIE